MAAAIIPLIPSIISGAPALISAITNVISGLVHKHQAATQPAPSATAPTATAPASGAQKKAAAMNDFMVVGGPLIAYIIKAETGKDVDIAALESAASALIDDIVALNKALGIFQPSPTTTVPAAS